MVGVLVTGSSGMVLCVGDDGRLAVAREHHGHCGDAHRTAATEHDGAALWGASAAACEAGGCVDLPLEIAKLSRPPKPLTQDHLQKSRARAPFSTGYDPSALTGVHGCQRPVYGATHILAQSLLEKRTIVLLV